MKPRTKLDKRALAASKHLPSLNATQVEWAKEHCFDQLAYWSGNSAWCSHCGGTFSAPKSELLVNSVMIDSLTCPHCGKVLKPEKSRRRKISEEGYLTIVTTCHGLQVQRTFEVARKGRKDGGVEYSFNEVVQLWLDEYGSESIIACRRVAFSFYHDKWVYGTMSCKRHDGYMYGNPYMFYGKVYPRRRILPVLKRNGYRPIDGVVPHCQMAELIREPKAETLQKSGQHGLLAYMVNRGWKAEKEWHAVKVAIRNRYIIEDATMWIDTLRAMRYLGLDTHSPHYVCPADFKGMHDMVLARAERKRVAEERAEQRRKARESEAEFHRAKSRFFGLLITDGSINIRPLKSVDEFADEGEAMHHCVFAGGYYKREDSLILTARSIEDKRLETIEIDLNNFKVVQSRGVNNMRTKDHDHIVNLVNKNINKIKRLAI